jgi:hypothetical protein
MPLEFALRQRINLERPARRRRPDWLRLPPLALPVGLYWAALGGVFWALYPRPASDSARNSADPAQTSSFFDFAFGSDDQSALDSLSESEKSPPSTIVTSAPAVPAAPALSVPVPAESAPSAEPAAPTALVVRAEPPPLPQANDARELSRLDTTSTQSTERPLTSRAEPPLERRAEPRARRTASQTSLREEPSSFPSPFEQPDWPAARIDSAIPKRSEEPAIPPPATRADEARIDARAAGGLPSCETAASSASETIDLGSTPGARGAPDITRDAFARILENGSYLSRCAIPASVAVDVCAAVQEGKVVGITVSTQPRSAAVNACVRRAVAGLRFPRNAHLDVTRTHFAPDSP